METALTRYAADQPPSDWRIAPFTLAASSLPIHEMALAIWSGDAIGPIVALDSCARSMAHDTVGAADAPMPVATPPGRTAFDRIPAGP